MKLFTEIPLDKIAEYEKLSGSEMNAVKVVLADEATRMLHGDECLKAIHGVTQSVFGTSAEEGSSNSQEDVMNALPQVQLDAADLNSDGAMPVANLLVKAGFAASKAAGRRLIALGGARVNDVTVVDERANVTVSDFHSQGRLKLSGSKKKHASVLLPAKQ
jgi:tyrosyl-tRNA synthetase